MARKQPETSKPAKPAPAPTKKVNPTYGAAADREMRGMEKDAKAPARPTRKS